MTTNENGSTQAANLGFEAELFLAADKLRGSMDASEYKHVVLGLVFLKYISDAFSPIYDKLKADEYDDEEDPVSIWQSVPFGCHGKRAGVI